MESNTITREKFEEEVFEIAFGDNAINRNFTYQEVLDELKKFSEFALLYEENLNNGEG